MSSFRGAINGLIVRVGDRFINMDNVTHILPVKPEGDAVRYRVFFINGMSIDLSRDAIKDLVIGIKPRERG